MYAPFLALTLPYLDFYLCLVFNTLMLLLIYVKVQVYSFLGVYSL